MSDTTIDLQFLVYLRTHADVCSACGQVAEVEVYEDGQDLFDHCNSCDTTTKREV